MKKTLRAEISVVINASAAKVWDALINPQIIKQYLFGTNAISDWKVGSKIVYKGVWQGKAYEDKGVILRMEPQKVLETNYWSGFSGLPDVPQNYQKVTYRLSKEKKGTKLTITQGNIATEESKAHSEKNWEMVLQALKNLLER